MLAAPCPPKRVDHWPVVRNCASAFSSSLRNRRVARAEHMETSVQRRMRMSKDCSAPQQDGFPGPQHQRKKRGCQQQGCQRNSARWEARSGDLAVHAFVFFPLLAARPRAHGHGRPPSRRQDRDGSLVSTARLPLASRVLSWRPGWSRGSEAAACVPPMSSILRNKQC
mmetsp:Transcript_8348/g.32928  ORF Transcript_8348/g.32928 Transcript_8348/m.32928 type:complete len:168 (+) Transcript_8348:278-781(+)